MKYNAENPIQNIPEYDGIGIYALIAENGKMYIGSSKHIKSRIKFHNSTIKNKQSCSAALVGHTFTCQILKRFEYGTITPLQLVKAEEEIVRGLNHDKLLNFITSDFKTSNHKKENDLIISPDIQKAIEEYLR